MITKVSKLSPFWLLGLLLLTLVVATLLEKSRGTEWIAKHVYSAAWFVALWGVLAAWSLWYLLRKGVGKRLVTLLLHLSFVLICVGAFTTWLMGEQGIIHLRQGETTTRFTDKDGVFQDLPFKLSLQEFSVIHHEGTDAPMDYVSQLQVAGRGSCEVRMNKPLVHRNYRFYQSSYDADERGTTLSVSHDPYGIFITYCAYGLLALSLILFPFERKSAWRGYLRQLRGKALLFAGIAGLCSSSLQAAENNTLTISSNTATASSNTMATSNYTPLAVSHSTKPADNNTIRAENSSAKTTPADIAEEFGRLHVLYNGRICPVQALAKDFAAEQTYTGLTANQALVEALFSSGDREASPHNVSPLLKIYPYRDAKGGVTWYAQGDDLPKEASTKQLLFLHRSMDCLQEQVMMQNWPQVRLLIGKLRKYQEEEAGSVLPSPAKFRAELWYNQGGYFKPASMIALTLGLLSFVFFIGYTHRAGRLHRIVSRTMRTTSALLLLYLTLMIALRGYISGYFPLSNGFETMQCIAWCALLGATFSSWLRPYGLMLCGLALLVSTWAGGAIGGGAPLRPIMPVLSSPLLSIHVVVIMLSYTLGAFMLFNGVAGLLVKDTTRSMQLALLSRVMLYPTVALLAIGVFVGAVWANMSWGRYWGWDPKEVWALITLLVYAVPLHANIAWLRTPRQLHCFTIIAFLCILITYFGVNYLLGGLHSYANV